MKNYRKEKEMQSQGYLDNQNLDMEWNHENSVLTMEENSREGIRRNMMVGVKGDRGLRVGKETLQLYLNTCNNGDNLNYKNSAGSSRNDGSRTSWSTWVSWRRLARYIFLNIWILWMQ